MSFEPAKIEHCYTRPTRDQLTQLLQTLPVPDSRASANFTATLDVPSQELYTILKSKLPHSTREINHLPPELRGPFQRFVDATHQAGIYSLSKMIVGERHYDPTFKRPAFSPMGLAVTDGELLHTLANYHFRDFPGRMQRYREGEVEFREAGLVPFKIFLGENPEEKYTLDSMDVELDRRMIGMRDPEPVHSASITIYRGGGLSLKIFDREKANQFERSYLPALKQLGLEFTETKRTSH